MTIPASQWSDAFDDEYGRRYELFRHPYGFVAAVHDDGRMVQVAPQVDRDGRVTGLEIMSDPSEARRDDWDRILDECRRNGDPAPTPYVATSAV